MERLGQNGKMSREAKKSGWVQANISAKTMINVRCGKPCVLGQLWEAEAGMGMSWARPHSCSA